MPLYKILPLICHRFCIKCESPDFIVFIFKAMFLKIASMKRILQRGRTYSIFNAQQRAALVFYCRR